jgi:site-specific DNA-methyltransferase (adenine-specific)
MEQFWSRRMSLVPYFERDGVTLYHGDCREILPKLQSESFDLVLTDPPYLVSYSGRWGSEFEPIAGDSDPTWVVPVYQNLFRLLKSDSLCLTFFGWPHAETFLSSWHEVGFRPVSLFVLVKRRIGLGYFSRAQHEQAYLLAKGKPNRPLTAPSDVLDWVTPFPTLHPNQKPVGAISTLLHSFSSQTSAVLDPFCGSGTTLVAAHQAGRRAVGIEIDERFCELAAMRLSQGVFRFAEPPTHQVL